MEQLSLSELQQQIKRTLYGGFPDTVWLVAEINQLNENRNGHCYLELIEKHAKKGSPKAKAKATIWAYPYNLLRNYFESVTGNELQAGMKVLLRVSVEFHEIYGLSLNVSDIDPAYTLGDIEKQRRETIQELKDAGIFDMNKGVPFTETPRRIAVISSDTAAGYDDFTDHLLNNEYGYTFEVELFSANMQGAGTEKSVIAALDAIYQQEQQFDAVVIIRGGGSKADLAAFDSFDIAANIAQFPLPVFTGIGHARDESVCDMVAHLSLKTPTAVAEYFVTKLQNTGSNLHELEQRLGTAVQALLADSQNKLLLLKQQFNMGTQAIVLVHKTKSVRLEQALVLATRKALGVHKLKLEKLTGKQAMVGNAFVRQQKTSLAYTKKRLEEAINRNFIKEKHQLEILNQKIHLHHPKRILERGYSLSLLNGKVLKSVAEIKEADVIETVLVNGSVLSRVNEIKRNG